MRQTIKFEKEKLSLLYELIGYIWTGARWIYKRNDLPANVRNSLVDTENKMCFCNEILDKYIEDNRLNDSGEIKINNNHVSKEDIETVTKCHRLARISILKASTELSFERDYVMYKQLREKKKEIDKCLELLSEEEK